MIVNYKRDFTDVELQRIKLALGGRSGKATRKAVRLWLAKQVDFAIDSAPHTKPPREKREPTPVVDETHDKPCKWCGQAFVAHAGMSRSCPLSKGVKPGHRYTEAA